MSSGCEDGRKMSVMMDRIGMELMDWAVGISEK